MDKNKTKSKKNQKQQKQQKQQQKATILFKKYLIINKLDEGSFGSIYLAKNIKTNQKVAIKVENRRQYKPLLEREAYILFYLKGPGLPEIISFGKTNYYFILVQTLLGPSLSSLLDNYNISFTIKDICMLSIQMLERLEYIHSKDYIHRDIKPQNFLIGLKDPSMLYIIDFGLSKKYRSKKGKHIKFSITNNIIGTPRYCSVNALRGAEQSRKDDLESLFYVILFFFKGNVPWQNLKIKSRNERFNKINEIKKKINYKILCKDLPNEFYEFGNYIKHLNFEDNPDYNYMKKLFYLILSNLSFENDDKFSWIKSSIFINSKSNSHSHKNIFNRNRKPSAHKRLLEKISNSLEKKFIERKKNLNAQTNSIKDNITLVSLNIEKINNQLYDNKIRKSSSFVGINDISTNNSKYKNALDFNHSNKKSEFYNSKTNDIIKVKEDIDDKKLVIKKSPIMLKIKEIDNILDSDNIKNKHYSKKNNLSTKNNKSIENLIFRNNKLFYTSPNYVSDLKQSESSLKNSISNLNVKSSSNINKNINKILKINKNNLNNSNNINNNINTINQYNYKKINSKFSNYKIKINNYYHNDQAEKNYYQNFNFSQISNINNNNNNKYNRKLFNININKINTNNKKKSCFHNNSNSNILGNCLRKNKKSISISNKIYTYNGEGLKFLNEGFNLSKIISPINASYKNRSNFNIKNESFFNRENIMKSCLPKNQSFNVNIKLISNNNYNNIPLIEYGNNSQVGGINYSSFLREKKNLKNENINKINNISNINKQTNTSRIIKYKAQRNIKMNTINNYNKKNFEINELNNETKIMKIPTQRNQFNSKLNLYNNNNRYNK